VVADKRIVESKPTAEQVAMVARVREVLSGKSEASPPAARLDVSIKALKGGTHEPQA
jgi:hypothetical protein